MMKEKITVKDILNDNYNDFKNKYWNKVPKDMRKHIDEAVATAQAGELMGNKLNYLEAGSGAKQSVPLEMIQEVAKNTTIPLVVGGGITSLLGIQNAYEAGADLVVIGTAFEKNPSFFLLEK